MLARGRNLTLALLAIAAVGVAIALYFTRNSTLDAARMAAYFPEREAVVAYIDVAAMRGSGLLEKIFGSTVAEAAEYRTFIEQTGFDYKRDLDRVMVNSAGGIHYFLMQGRFDWNKLRSYAENNGGKCKGDDCWAQGSKPELIVSFRPLRKDLLAMATARDESGAKAVDRRSAVELPFSVPGEPVWVHVPSQSLPSGSQLPAGTQLFARALAPAERVLFTLGPAQSNFTLVMDVACKTADEATTLRAQLEGLTQLLEKFIVRENQKPNPKDLSGVLTSGAFTRDDRHVFGKWTIERGFLESLGGS